MSKFVTVDEIERHTKVTICVPNPLSHEDEARLVGALGDFIERFIAHKTPKARASEPEDRLTYERGGDPYFWDVVEALNALANNRLEMPGALEESDDG